MELNAQQIQALIPHRYPFLLVDRVIELEPGVRAVGLKNVSANEPYFQGHFPGYPIMPGVLLVEALAQVGVVVALSMPENRGKVVFFAGIDRFRFRQAVVPGDTVRLEVTLTRMRGPIGKAAATASVEGKLVGEGELTFALGEMPAP